MDWSVKSKKYGDKEIKNKIIEYINILIFVIFIPDATGSIGILALE